METVLGPHHFRRSKHEWFHEGGECLTAVSLEKSRFGGQFYVDLGASPIRLVGGSHLREYECHFRVRLELIIPNRDELLSAMDLEDQSVSKEQRRRIFDAALGDYGVPMLLQLRSLEGIAALVGSHPSARAFMIRPELRGLLAGMSKS